MTKTLSNFITVVGPTADFISATPGGCANKPTVFNDLSTPAGGITTWAWDFGDGTQQTFTASPFTHIYTQTGSYPVKLTVTDAGGCKDTRSLPVNLHCY